MLRIEAKTTEVHHESGRGPMRHGDGLLFLGVLAASWAVVIVVVWAVWRLMPL